MKLISTAFTPDTSVATSENSTIAAAGDVPPNSSSNSIPTAAPPYSTALTIMSSLRHRRHNKSTSGTDATVTTGSTADRKIDSDVDVPKVSFTICGTHVRIPSFSTPISNMAHRIAGRPEISHTRPRRAVPGAAAAGASSTAGASSAPAAQSRGTENSHSSATAAASTVGTKKAYRHGSHTVKNDTSRYVPACPSAVE